MRFVSPRVVPSILMLSMFVVESVLLAVPPASATPFVHDVVDTAGIVGDHTSLELNARGEPRISYFDDTNNNLKYAHKNGSVWTIETVDAPGDVGYSTSLELDALGNPRIAYYDFTNQNLKYASKSGAVWSTEVVHATGDVGWHPSLALDAQGNPRISYYDNTNGDLMYASKSGAVWTLESVDVAGNVGWFSSLALGAQGAPHISYYDIINDSLKYAYKSGGTWVLAAPGGVGLHSSLALDAQGGPHISFSQGNLLRYLSKINGVWIFDTADPNGGQLTSLALDADGSPNISYTRSGAFYYATKKSGSWTREAVDATGAVGLGSSLALDAQGNPKISYHDVSNGDLKYTDSALRVVSPAGGETWPVGALRTLTWSGAGVVDVFLTADGGATYTQLLDDIQGSTISNAATFRVPHVPTRFARLEVRRPSFFSTAVSESSFTIQGSIALLSFDADPPSDSHSGVHLSWATNPGPEDLNGYRLEGSDASGNWATVVELTRETAYVDADGGPGSRYRLTAQNGLGAELVLGEVSVRPAAPLAAWPLPYRGGELNVSFAAAGGFGQGQGEVTVSVFDISGRLVRTLVNAPMEQGFHSTTWNGADMNGRAVSNGVYFVRVESGGYTEKIKLVVLR